MDQVNKNTWNICKLLNDDVEGFKKIVRKIVVSSNVKLVGIGNGATFINENLSQYMNFVSGLALINPEGTTGKLSASVPTYVSGNTNIAKAYIEADHAAKINTDGSVATYQNPDSRFEIVVADSSSKNAVDGYKAAWETVLCKYGRIAS